MKNKLTKNKTILLIEDEIPTLEILYDRFTKEGFRVLKARDGENGLELALKEHPDLILLDIILPKVNGIEILRKLRADNWGKDALVIILTNLSDIRTAADTLENGVYSFMVKSAWKLEDLVKNVKEKLKLR